MQEEFLTREQRSNAPNRYNDGEITPADISQMMYDFDVLLEEFLACRTYLFSLINPMSNKEFFFFNKKDLMSVAYRFGYISYYEKELGKKIGMTFSFRLDVYDEIFSTPVVHIVNGSLPARDKLLQYHNDIHEAFLAEIKTIKRAEALFALLNQDYIQIHFIAKRCQELSCSSAPKKPLSKRVVQRIDGTKKLEYYLPAYTN